MINYPIYRFVLFSVLALTLWSCNSRFDERLSLWRNDKIPYGTYYSYNNLDHIFQDADIETTNKSPVSFYSLNETGCAYIIIGKSVIPNEKELKAILNYALAGNQVFISAYDIGDNLLDSFKLSVSSTLNFFSPPDSLTISILDPESEDSILFAYPGKRIQGYFSKLDSSITTILGRDVYGRANFVKFTYHGGGTIFLHLTPTAFTNFFLLHKQNKQYYDIALSSMPDTLSKVRWDDYYRHHRNGDNDSEKSGFSKLAPFLNNEILSWAFWLTLLLFAFIYLFESKRKQRVIPVLKSLSNTSVDFVKTIGRLYFQRKDNINLSNKMATHFLTHVRTRYNLSTSQLDDEFAKKLAYKSGHSLTGIQEIIQYINETQSASNISDGRLLAFHEKIDTFINKP